VLKRKGFQDAILTIFRRHDLFLQVEHALSLSSSAAGGESNQTPNQNQSNMDEERRVIFFHILKSFFHLVKIRNSSSSRSFSKQLLDQLIKQKLISLDLAMQIDPTLLNEPSVPKWYAEAGDAALDADVSVSLFYYYFEPVLSIFPVFKMDFELIRALNRHI
jgi:hypothetical protein